MDKNPKMLIVEDSTIGRTIIRNIFKKDYTIMEAADGQEAVDALHKDFQIKIVLLDLKMPNVNGFEVLRLMNQEGRLRKIPVLVITSSEEEEISALQLGATDFVKKPYQAGVLRQRVDTIVRGMVAERERLEDDITKAYELMRYRAEHDNLTGICNRESFYEKTRTLVLKNTKTQYMIGRLNIERFKVINDIFGTAAGDVILKGIAEILTETLYGVGTYARLEADHFVFCVPEGYTSPEKLLAKADEKFKEYHQNYHIECSLGIYRVEDYHLPVDQMCDRANMALQMTKNSYTTRYAYYDETLRNAILMEQRISNEMNTALQEEQFKVYMQPIVNAKTGRIETAEALVRWDSPALGSLSPGEFVPIFERNGFITRLDEYMWEKICSYIHDGLEQNHPVLPISVNVSRVNLYNSNLCSEIKELTERYKVPHELLRLEITESAYMDNPRQLIEITKQLRESGFKILMDDFGSGYSSLSMLAELPVDILKIDMRFIDELDTSHRAGSIITSVIRMAKWLEIGTIAEGIETKAQLEFLQMVGCEYVQGFYYAKPMAIDDFRRLLQHESQAQESDSEKIMPENLNNLYTEIDENVKAQQMLYNTARELQKALDDEELVLECAKELSAIQNPDTAIKKVLGILLTHYEGDRTYIFENNWQNKTTSNTYESFANGRSEEINNCQNISMEAMHFWFSQFEQGKYLYIDDTTTLRGDRAEMGRILCTQGIRSLLAVPFYDGDKVSGFVGVDNPKIRRDAPHVIINLTYFIANELEKEKIQKRLQYLSFHDTLTGLYNRNKYVIYAETFNKEKNHTGAGIVYLDVNGLKTTNDTRGHKHGDILIMKTADKLKKVFPDDMVFRLSGDEFLVVADHCGKKEFQNKVMGLKRIMRERDQQLASLGYIWQKEPENLEALANAADQEMYADKKNYYANQSGRDRRKRK